jgi:predicted membrane-bound dolichyl-phosphate-mannose-protein mannosyltransferase
VVWPESQFSFNAIDSPPMVEALSGVSLLDLYFSYFNQKFLVYSYAKSDDALWVKLKPLADPWRI